MTKYVFILVSLLICFKSLSAEQMDWHEIFTLGFNVGYKAALDERPPSGGVGSQGTSINGMLLSNGSAQSLASQLGTPIQPITGGTFPSGGGTMLKFDEVLSLFGVGDEEDLKEELEKYGVFIGIDNNRHAVHSGTFLYEKSLLDGPEFASDSALGAMKKMGLELPDTYQALTFDADELLSNSKSIETQFWRSPVAETGAKFDLQRLTLDRMIPSTLPMENMFITPSFP